MLVALSNKWAIASSIVDAHAEPRGDASGKRALSLEPLDHLATWSEQSFEIELVKRDRGLGFSLTEHKVLYILVHVYSILQYLLYYTIFVLCKFILVLMLFTALIWFCHMFS